MPIAVETEIDLPDKLSIVEIALMSQGVSFAAFVVDLWLDDNKVADIKPHGTEADIGSFFPSQSARALRGLVVVTRGIVGAAAPAHLTLRSVFRCDSRLYRSAPAVIDLSENQTSEVFRIRCPIV